MIIPPAIQTFLEPWSIFLAEDPLLRILQFAMLLGGVIAVFLVFYTTRDILLRSNSFLYMFISILLVAALPVVGFFLYLLIRPSRTIKDRQFHAMLEEFIASQQKVSVPKQEKVEKAEKVEKVEPAKPVKVAKKKKESKVTA